MADDAQYMQRAFDLAANGRGHVEPNPMVGAVIVRDGVVVGEGYHERFGGPHAEVHAIARAGEQARGATIYVTLEPCCHHGKTPPCTDAVLGAGITRVFAAMSDPNPKVAGQGIAQLRRAGVAVDVGLGEAQARALNAPFLRLIETGVPYVHAKWAMTLDGKIATASGESKWISGEPARRVVHELRGRMDAIVVGIGTALADDPMLTARPPGPRVPLRVVLDSACRIPVQSQLVATARDVPVLVAVSNRASASAVQELRRHGCECLELPCDERGLDVLQLLRELGRRRHTNVLVEGGSRLLGAFRDADLLDELHVFVAPRLLGGSGITAIAGTGAARMGDASAFELVDVRQVGEDCYMHARRS
jgi:diaminohydroxyphosphoribosylaminopyrimidine deaminase/5-amino-6-(5-phosphoribosylamino)uracil reductase